VLGLSIYRDVGACIPISSFFYKKFLLMIFFYCIFGIACTSFAVAVRILARGSAFRQGAEATSPDFADAGVFGLLPGVAGDLFISFSSDMRVAPHRVVNG
jgi:hypothetical protein